MRYGGSTKKDRRKLNRDRLCLFCKKKRIPPTSFFYCSNECRVANATRRWRTRRVGRIQKSYRTQQRVPRNRHCDYCDAYDTEVLFYRGDRCAACEKGIERYGTCDGGNKHVLVVRSIRGCVHCDMPHDALKILLVEQGGLERERYVFRAVNEGCVLVAREHRVINGLPMVVTLPTELYVKTRC